MYFDAKTRTSVLDRIGEIIAQDGALLVGPAESYVGYELGYVAADSAPGLLYKNRPVPLRRRLAG
jgi:chemotaxis protein methyltransferase CheR